MADDAGVAQILLVRAVEESDHDALPTRALGDAAVEAGELDDPLAWLGRRAAVLVTRMPAAYAALPAVLDRGARWGLRGAIALAAVLGVAVNYLGPSDRIHVVWNPILLLVAWNVVLYVALTIRWSWPRLARRRAIAAPASEPASR
ncbi:MAG TPA: hypothetical protein VGR62_18840, partial [Candidatus Binatia bacterium]|nr:hypothetical protein [Candidatus Binatia bacterium]